MILARVITGLGKGDRSPLHRQLSRSWFVSHDANLDRKERMTFTEWLKSKADRTDSVGDLARATAADLLAPKGDARLAHWREHLEDNRAGREMFRALEEAWREYGVLH
jgi:hypothetical protein